MTSTTSGRERQRDLHRRSGGFSVIEMTVAVAVAVVIGMGLYFVFTSQQRASRSQKSYNDLQTRCSFAMDTIKKELLLAGYRARNTLEPISGPGASAITFEYWDDHASVAPPYDDVTQFTNQTQVTYSLAGTNLNKTMKRWHTPSAEYDTPLTFPLAENVQSLGFAYFKEDNVPWSSGESKSLIRTVRISLLCRAAQADALQVDPTRPGGGTPQYQTVALTAEVRPRNIAVAERPEDRTPPAVPLTTGNNPRFWAWDEGQCGCLKIRWTSNTDADIAGYTVYYGLIPGTYIGRTRVTHQDAAEQEIQLRNLSATNAPYYIALAAYDKSGNQSALSAAFSGNPTPSLRERTDSGNDTAITPEAPAAPVAPTISTPADNHLQISWQSDYTDCNTEPDFGYRLYRSTDPNFVPDGDEGGEGNCIADELDLRGPTATSYLDTGVDTMAGNLTGCIPWYYKIAVVTCDPGQLTAYTDGDAATPTTYTAASFASVSGTPTDGTKTSAPRLTATPGWRRITLTIEHPPRSAFPDFMHTRVYFSTTGPPQLTEARDADGFNVVNNGRLVPDNGGIFGVGPGAVESFSFDDEDNEIPPGGLGDPQLRPDATYYFLAVSYDQCKNHAEGEVSRDAARQCNDCELGVTCRDAPPMPENLRITEGCSDALRLEWDYPASYYMTHPDFQGFRVVRCEGAGCVPQDPFLDPASSGMALTGTYLIGLTTYLDDTVEDGRVYNYRVFAGDCYYQRWLEGLLTTDEVGANPPGNNADYADKTGAAVGFFDRARVEGDQETTLAADIDNAVTTIPVESTAGWTRSQLTINDEIITCGGFSLTAFTGCKRGQEGTTATGHFQSTPVRSFPYAPARAAVTGDLSLVPPTFLHNTVIVAARNTSAGTLTLNQLTSSWDDPATWFTELLYENSVRAFFDDPAFPPLDHDYSGTTVTLEPIVVEALDQNIPLKLTFHKSDGTVDPTVDLREDEFILNWSYANDATGVAPCTYEWRPPAVAGIVGPPGPSIAGTTQTAPTYGTVAWPVPGLGDNPPGAIISPANVGNQVTTNVHDNSGAGLATVRLYYATTDPGVEVAPETVGAYPGCAPYTKIDMGRIEGTDVWSGAFPASPRTPEELNNRNVWYYIVAVDNEGNFDREPEAGQGAFQYFQQPVDPCLSIPGRPLLENTLVTSSSVRLDWSASWFSDPPFYPNADGSPCVDLEGFRVYHQLSGGGWSEVPGSPFPPTTQTYTHTFSPAMTSLSAGIASTDNVIPVGSTADFRGSGKIRIDSEVIAYSGKTDNSFVGCLRGRDLTLPAAHGAGTAVTQDLLALERNSFFVRAFDSCPVENYGSSSVFTEGIVCNPTCDLKVYPAWGSIVPGSDFQVEVEACQKAGNGAVDTIYVHLCSSVEGDDFALVEDPEDTGTFSGFVHTQLGTGPDGTNSTLVVANDDAILVGGFSSSPGSWSSIDTCSGRTFSCGDQAKLVVSPTLVDFCADDHTPDVPFSLSAAPYGASCSGAGTSQMTLSWNQVSVPLGCNNFYYKGFMCEGSSCEPTAPVNGFFTSVEKNCAGSTCTSNPITIAPSKFHKKVYNFKVSAVCEINVCLPPSTTRTWESGLSAASPDACP